MIRLVLLRILAHSFSILSCKMKVKKISVFEKVSEDGRIYGQPL